MPAEVARIGKQFMKDPIEITVEQRTGSATVSHEFYLVNARDRYEALKRLADANPDIFSVILSYQKRYTLLRNRRRIYMPHCTEIYLKRNVMV
jgi:ATP-dependent RNA helicase DeaD